MRCSFWSLVLLGVWLSAVDAQEGLAKKIEAVIDGKDYTEGHWGVLVADAKTGETVYGRNERKLFAPASTTKLYTCAAALIAFGKDHKFVTPVHRRGEIDPEGNLRGDLILVASGDPSFGGRTTPEGTLAFRNGDHTYANGSAAELTDTNPLFAFEDLAKQIKAAGIKSVYGEVLIDDRLFHPTQSTGSGPSAVTPIIVNDNVIDLTFTPGEKAGDPAKVTARPETAFFTLDAVVSTGAKGSATLTSFDLVNGYSLAVRGSIPVGSKPVVRVVSVENPANLARTVFIEALRKAGIVVKAPLARPVEIALPDDYDKLPKVAAHSSPPLSELVKVILKVSHNLYASTLPCLLAAKHGAKSLSAGLREEGNLLKGLGVDTATISFGGGAGGANADAVTPRATVQLLSGMAKQPDWPAFKAALPVLGVDGTLAEVVDKDSPARGKVFAKTGTLFWTDGLNGGRSLLRSKALAGVMTTKTGRELYVTMFINDVPLPVGVGPSREGKVLGKLCEIIYENAD